ncbi:leucine-rich repeat domain-containing protein [Salinispira pacifica]
MGIEELHAEIRSKVTAEHLKELTVSLIDAYKARNMRVLERYADQLFGPPDGEREANELFLKLIKHLHPDRLNGILREVDDALARGDEQRLLFFGRIMSVRKQLSVRRGAHESARYSRDAQDRSDLREEYTFGREDFGYDTTAYNEGVFSEEEDEFYSEAEVDFDFLSAVKAEHLGNLDIEITAADLQYLEGELVLSGYELSDLDGLEKCVNLTVLDLSDNRIDNIYEVQFLRHLQELFLSNNHIVDIDVLRDLEDLEILDLSFNDIENASVLSDLPALRFVNLTGNPIGDRSPIEELERRSVVVLY